jgi:uncharacterized membrane protein (UPF0127 family)
VTHPGDASRPASAGPRRRRLRVAAVAAVAVVVAVAVGVRASVDREDRDPSSEAVTSAVAPAGQGRAGVTLPGGCGDGGSRQRLDGFAEATFQVSAPDGAPAFRGCALLAEAPEARSRGLMGQDDLLGYDAMVFRFPAPSTSSFYMFRTTLALSIAFVAADGGVVSTTDMAPCPAEEAADCPTYAADAPYLHAVEVAQGDLPSIGIVPGAAVTFEEAA